MAAGNRRRTRLYLRAHRYEPVPPLQFIKQPLSIHKEHPHQRKVSHLVNDSSGRLRFAFVSSMRCSTSPDSISVDGLVASVLLMRTKVYSPETSFCRRFRRRSGIDRTTLRRPNR